MHRGNRDERVFLFMIGGYITPPHLNMCVFDPSINELIETSDRRTSNTSRLHLEQLSREDRDRLMSSSRMNALRSEHSRTFF
jgi:hypothetical protein